MGRKFLKLILAAFFAGAAWGDNGIFNNIECRVFLSQIKNHQIEYQAEADAYGLSGNLRTEYIERQKRVAWLYQEAKHFYEAQTFISFVTEAYEIANHPYRGPSLELWRNAIDQGLKKYAGTDLASSEALGTLIVDAPEYLSASQVPLTRDSINNLRALSTLLSDLANYRLFFSREMSRAPFHTTITGIPENHHSRLVGNIEKAWAQRARYKGNFADPGRQLPERPAGSDWGWVFAVRELARSHSTNPLCPVVVKNQLLRHLNFLDKYSLEPNFTFVSFVLTVQRYLESGELGDR